MPLRITRISYSWFQPSAVSIDDEVDQRECDTGIQRQQNKVYYDTVSTSTSRITSCRLLFPNSHASTHSVVRHNPDHEGKNGLWPAYSGRQRQKPQVSEYNADTAALEAISRPSRHQQINTLSNASLEGSPVVFSLHWTTLAHKISWKPPGHNLFSLDSATPSILH